MQTAAAHGHVQFVVNVCRARALRERRRKRKALRCRPRSRGHRRVSWDGDGERVCVHANDFAFSRRCGCPDRLRYVQKDLFLLSHGCRCCVKLMARASEMTEAAVAWAPRRTVIVIPFSVSALARSSRTSPLMVSPSKYSGACFDSAALLLTWKDSQSRPLLSRSA